MAIDNLQFSGAPGYNYSLLFLSSGINELLPSNQDFLEAVQAPQIDLNFTVGLRECIVGEYFTALGECVECDPSQGFTLSPLKKPGSCTPCPTDKAACQGGSIIGPLPGYWRPSNTSDNFLHCPNPGACLGWVAPEWNPIGACAEGYTGVLCAEC